MVIGFMIFCFILVRWIRVYGKNHRYKDSESSGAANTWLEPGENKIIKSIIKSIQPSYSFIDFDHVTYQVILTNKRLFIPMYKKNISVPLNSITKIEKKEGGSIRGIYDIDIKYSYENQAKSLFLGFGNLPKKRDEFYEAINTEIAKIKDKDNY